ncbi:MAG: DNA polymerase III subunit delta [Frankia sp.]
MSASTGLPPLVLVSGDEELLVARAVSSALVAARGRDPEVEIVDRGAAELTDSDVLDMASPSMFGGLRVLVVRGAQDLGEELRDALIAYAARPLDDVMLVVVHSGANRNRKLIEAFKGAGARVIPASKVTRPQERREFVVAEVRRQGGRISEDAARALLEAVGGELRELAAVCEQVVADTDGIVDERAVARYHRGRAETTGFAVADAAIAGDLPQALTLLRQALDHGTAAVLVSSAVATGLRDLARVASSGGGSKFELAKRLGMPDWKIERAQRSARSWSEEGLARAIGSAAVADAAVKGAGVDSGYALERLVMDVVGSRGRSSGRPS